MTFHDPIVYLVNSSDQFVGSRVSSMDIKQLPYQIMDMLSDAVAVMDQNGVVVQVGDSFKNKCCDLFYPSGENRLRNPSTAL